MICQSDRFPEMFMISQTPIMGEHQNTSDRRRNAGKTLPHFW